MRSEAYYKPSGKISGLYILLFLVFSIICIPLLSAAYIYLVYYIPFIYISIFIAVGCGCAWGYIMGLAAKLGKARNPLVVIIFTCITAVIMKYIQWCFYIPLVYNDLYEFYEYYYGYALTIGEQLYEAFFYMLDPAVVWACILEVNEFGVWGISNNGGDVNNAVTGVMLWIVWVIEFLIITGMALFLSRERAASPYSEESAGWYTVDSVYELDNPANFDSLKSSLEGGNAEAFIAKVMEGVSNPNDFLKVTFHKPPQPSHTEPYYMNIEQIFVNEKNKSSVKLLVVHLAFSTHNMNMLKNAEPTENPNSGFNYVNDADEIDNLGISDNNLD